MRKVITYGTFDLFHKGHYNILKRAKEQGDYLIVGVTSESYDIERGKLSVQDSLTKRIENVRKTGFADEIIIEEYMGQKIRDIIKYDIDALVIGSDWKGKLDHLKKYCEIIYLERTKDISSTQIREQSNSFFRIGIITDTEDDKRIVDEVKYVSGLHVESVFSKDDNCAQQFGNKYQVGHNYTDFSSFLDTVDVVIVSTTYRMRFEYVKACLENGKHVISESPVILDAERIQELQQISSEKGVIFIENITTVYLRAFSQLSWLSQDDIVGKILAVKCVASKDYYGVDKSTLDMTMIAVTMIVKLLGIEFTKISTSKIMNHGKNMYTNIIFQTKDNLGSIEIGRGVELENQLEVIGENGTIIVKDDWWNTGYFEIHQYGKKTVKKYSYNLDGNGFRYILQEMLIMLKDKRTECTRLFKEESLAIATILKQITEEK